MVLIHTTIAKTLTRLMFPTLWTAERMKCVMCKAYLILTVASTILGVQRVRALLRFGICHLQSETLWKDKLHKIVWRQ